MVNRELEDVGVVVVEGGVSNCYFLAGLQKDRYRGTSGTKEGLSSIGRFRKNNKYCLFWSLFRQF